MNKTKLHRLLPRLILIAGGLGLLLRIWLLKTDAQGFLMPNPFAATVLIFLSLGVLAGLFLLSRDWQEGTKYSFNFPANPIAALGTALAAFSILLHSILSLSGSDNTFTTLTGILGIAAAAALGFCAWCRYLGKRPNFLFYLVSCVYFVFLLICQYRSWSIDPQLLDYAYPLLATVCLMLASYHRASFAADQGKRSHYGFFALAAVFFCCVSLTSWMDIVLYLGTGAWMLTDICKLTPMHNRGAT